MVSTPHGMNHFYRYWHDAERGKNEYIPTDVHWSQVLMVEMMNGEDRLLQTHLNNSLRLSLSVSSLGSVDTLISPSKLRTLVYENPMTRNAGLDIYENPVKGHDYLMTVDVARGVSEDYSAFVLVDITEFPHRVVGKYRNNEIKPMIFPNLIWEVAKKYNNAFILCEVNDIGDQVASILNFDLNMKIY